MGRTPWRRILSYDADVTMVIEARGHGKTFGLREQVLRDWLERGDRFVAVVRYAQRIPAVARDYFGLLSKPAADGLPASRLLREHHLIFKRRAGTLYAAEIPAEHLGDPLYKPAKSGWDIIGYFAALNTFQDAKEMTYAKVRRIIFDEALIERRDGRRDYLPGEYDDLVSLVDSVSRETPGDGRHKPNVYLLSNAAGGVANPYFAHFGIRSVPPKGFSWWDGKTLLLYVGDDREYSEAKARETVAGRMSRRTASAAVSVDNEFTSRAGAGLIERRPPQATVKYGIALTGRVYSVWVDMTQGLYYVEPGAPRGVDILALTTADNEVNYLMARRQEPELRGLCDAYRLRLLRFTDEATQVMFETQLMPLYGYRAAI